MSNAKVEINELTKTFGNLVVIHNITVTFSDNKINGIVGRNGSGKSVLMRLISGLYKPSKGTIIVDGKVVGKNVEYPDAMGILIETPGFLPFYSGYRNLKVLADINGKLSTTEIKNVMRTVGLEPDLKRHVAKYSMGMKQRLGIAQAIMESPKLLMLDEPFNGLDKNGVIEMRKLLLSLRKEGRVILLASHNQQDIDELCDTVYEIEQGMLTLIR